MQMLEINFLIALDYFYYIDIITYSTAATLFSSFSK